MNCFDCAALGELVDAVAVCADCGAALCHDHAHVTARWLTRTMLINRIVLVEPPARTIRCGVCQAAASLELTRYLTEEHDRIAQRMNDVVVRRIFAAGLDLQAALGLTGDHRAASKIWHAIDELDQAIRDIRNTIFDWQQDHTPRAHGRSSIGKAARQAMTTTPLHAEPT